jgi:hypothetical protein
MFSKWAHAARGRGASVCGRGRARARAGLGSWHSVALSCRSSMPQKTYGIDLLLSTLITILSIAHAADTHGITHYSHGRIFFLQIWRFYMNATEDSLTRWKFEATLEDRTKILQRPENYEFMLTHFCESVPLSNIPNATGVRGGCGVCKKYNDGCPAERADVGFADGSTKPYPHVMLGSGLNCMPLSKCLHNTWLLNLESFFNRTTKHVTKADLFMAEACNMPYIEQNEQGHVLLYMSFRFGIYIDFLKTQGALSTQNGTVMEVGAGWGGFATLFKHLVPGWRYIVLDIPSILPLQMSYAYHHGFKRIVTLKHDARKADVATLLCCTEFDFLFILPHQIDMLPDDSVDLTVNLDSMVEMPSNSISHYLHHISRVSQWFYANNRQGHYNGWPTFRRDTTHILQNNPKHLWKLVVDKRAPFVLPGANTMPFAKMNDNVMMGGLHTHLLLQRKANASTSTI